MKGGRPERSASAFTSPEPSGRNLYTITRSKPVTARTWLAASWRKRSSVGARFKRLTMLFTSVIGSVASVSAPRRGTISTTAFDADMWTVMS